MSFSLRGEGGLTCDDGCLVTLCIYFEEVNQLPLYLSEVVILNGTHRLQGVFDFLINRPTSIACHSF